MESGGAGGWKRASQTDGGQQSRIDERLTDRTRSAGTGMAAGSAGISNLAEVGFRDRGSGRWSISEMHFACSIPPATIIVYWLNRAAFSPRK